MKVNDIVKYKEGLFKIIDVHVWKFVSGNNAEPRFQIENINGDYYGAYVGIEDLQFISTYKDYLKGEIINELNEHFKDVAKVTSVIYYVERECFTVVLDYGKLATQMVYKYNNNRIAFGRHYTPLQLLKLIIEFFELGDE